MRDVDVIDDPAAAVVALDPVRARLLAELGEPRSASALAPRVGLTRQKVNYHLRTLEAHGLGRVGDLPAPLTLEQLLATAREVLPARIVRGVGDPAQVVRRLAVVGGAGHEPELVAGGEVVEARLARVVSQRGCGEEGRGVGCAGVVVPLDVENGALHRSGHQEDAKGTKDLWSLG